MDPEVFVGFCGGEERGAVKCEGQRGLYLTCPLHLSVRRRRRRAVWSARVGRVGARPVVAEAYMEPVTAHLSALKYLPGLYLETCLPIYYIDSYCKTVLYRMQ